MVLRLYSNFYSIKIDPKGDHGEGAIVLTTFTDSAPLDLEDDYSEDDSLIEIPSVKTGNPYPFPFSPVSLYRVDLLVFISN